MRFDQVVTKDMVNAEAERRILAIMPEYMQRNVMAQGLAASQQYGSDPAGWPPELQAVNNAVQTKWMAIGAIRAASNVLNSMSPIPANFAADSWWQ